MSHKQNTVEKLIPDPSLKNQKLSISQNWAYLFETKLYNTCF